MTDKFYTTNRYIIHYSKPLHYSLQPTALLNNVYSFNLYVSCWKYVNILHRLECLSAIFS